MSSISDAVWAVADFLQTYNGAVTAVGTVVIAIFTTILGIFTMSLARSTRVAAEAAKQSAEALPSLERAHIFVVPSLMWLRTQIPGTNGDAVTPTFNNKAFINCKFISHGKTPAIIKSAEMKIDLLATAPDNRKHSPNIILRDEKVLESKDEWSPKGTHSIDEGPLVKVFGEAEIRSLKEGNVLLWFYGSIVYEDVFGTEHCTRFRWSYAGGSSQFAASGSKPYNERA
jgi:hypothetical protein